MMSERSINRKRSKPETKNCLHVVSGPLSYNEMIDYLSILYDDLTKYIQTRKANGIFWPETRFLLNMPSCFASKAQDYCFVWFPTPFFYLLIGLNYDGKEIDKSSKGYQSPLVELRNDWSKDIVKPYSIPPYKRKDGSSYRPIFTSAHAERVGSEYIEGTLKCNNIPASIHIEEIANLFVPFVTNGRLKVLRQGTSCSITFSDPDDAYFALYMMKKHLLPSLNKPLVFDFQENIEKTEKRPFKRLSGNKK